MQATQDIHVRNTVQLITPRELKQRLPMTEKANQVVVAGREGICRILNNQEDRFMVVTGPCSIHDEKAALEYAERLLKVRSEVEDRLLLVMRVYFEKPRTTVGWKGLINDPFLDGSFHMEVGLQKARALLLKICEMGLPTATEMLDPITPQYVADLVAWASIGARTTESQTHRQMASGLSMPVGYKNSTDGNLQVAIDAMRSAAHPHSFLGIDSNGQTCVVNTRGNPWGHVILRGGRSGSNYGPDQIQSAIEQLRAAGASPNLVVDCSHANSGKDHRNQEQAFRSVVMQRAEGNRNIVGLMLESHLNEGNQPLTNDLSKLKYGVSITDACIGWDKTRELILFAHSALASHRAKAA